MRAIPQKERPGVELNTNNVIKLKRKRIKKINPLWIIAGLLAAILIAVLVILVRGGAEGIAETGSVTVDVDYNAVIVRNEKVITSEAFDLADYFAEEGAWVEPDTKIMQIYRRGYSEEQAAALMRKHAEIYDEQLALLGETRDKTIRGYDELIALLEENIAEELMAGNSAEVPRQEAELLDALSSRTDYLRKNLQETETLRALYMEAIADPEVKILSIATRPDCLGADVLALLDEINHIKPVWVELGLQTIHPETSAYIRRGYELSVFEQAVKELRAIGITVIVHTILYLPGETKDDMLDTIHYLNHMDIQGIKLQLLHVLTHTDLAADYEKHPFYIPDMQDYIQFLGTCIAQLNPEIVIHRLTGDGPKDLLIAPLWTSNKRTVLNQLHSHLKEQDIWQGKEYYV